MLNFLTFLKKNLYFKIIFSFIITKNFISQYFEF
jgi:hypothetical protein